MAQKRMVHRRITSSQKMHALVGKDVARVIYMALFPYTDKAGRLNANPMGLKGTIFEGFEYTVEQIDEALHDLAAVGLIVLYSNGGHKQLAQYTRFEEFNKPHPKEPESDLPGPEDSGSTVVGPAGNVPGDFPEGVGQGSTPTPTETPSPTRTPRDETDSSEGRMARAFATGQPQSSPKHRVRAELRRLAGPDFTQRHEQHLDAWTRWSDDQLRAMWEASDPARWPGETHKKRAWILKDLLDEERPMPRAHQADDVGRSFAEILAEAQRDLGVN